jgi:hypothetical protein
MANSRLLIRPVSEMTPAGFRLWTHRAAAQTPSHNPKKVTITTPSSE